MSDLSFIERSRLEKFFEMENGYVLNFSNSTFREFIIESVEIDIDDQKYLVGASGSKANRLRTFWKVESNVIVGKLISDLLKYCQERKSINNLAIISSEQDNFEKCLKISQRLIQGEKSDRYVDKITIDTHFEDNQKRIIENIKLAKFTIWVAVAWLTDKVLFDHLVAKKNQGLNVQVIINDDEINNNSGLTYDNLEAYRIKLFGKYENNIMHHKFCIIDLKIVISGSYNWTKRAQYNNETITVVTGYENAERFAEEFMQLKKP